MDAKLKLAIMEAIDSVIEDAAERRDTPPWDGWIHHGLVQQMADAAALVFDAAMETSRFVEQETIPS